MFFIPKCVVNTKLYTFFLYIPGVMNGVSWFNTIKAQTREQQKIVKNCNSYGVENKICFFFVPSLFLKFNLWVCFIEKKQKSSQEKIRF